MIRIACSENRQYSRSIRYCVSCPRNPAIVAIVAIVNPAIVDLGHGIYLGTIQINDNYTDAIAATYTYDAEPGVTDCVSGTDFTGNIDLISGSPTNSWAPAQPGC